ncbi:hypothetical protein [Rhodanobacter sp. MP1X3]|uniref:hypothetical protein n=1 Tax=Rhodanobacter sp. MP1X3 TaxID=2723086 RepID=UPI0016174205|nr:hypothetical protein [Rhodanobacter sp. MP1X3]MBB6241255.1 hypothetical protein [Rhodanobacter sp. MP1X3]
MFYEDGQIVMLDDFVDLGGGMTGKVVGLIEQNKYTEGYSGDDWGYLKIGVVVNTEVAGTIHYPESHVDFVLIKRA